MKIFKDMDDNQFYMTMWALVSVMVIIVASIIGFNTYNNAILKSELIKAGKDPIELACLYELNTHNSATCLILAQDKAKVK